MVDDAVVLDGSGTAGLVVATGVGADVFNEFSVSVSVDDDGDGSAVTAGVAREVEEHAAVAMRRTPVTSVARTGDRRQRLCRLDFDIASTLSPRPIGGGHSR